MAAPTPVAAAPTPVAAAPTPVAAAPRYHVQIVPGSDRMVYTPTTQWPDPHRVGLRQSFAVEHELTIHFDNEGRPCDLPHEATAEARAKMSARRMTPRNMAVPLADDLGRVAQHGT